MFLSILILKQKPVFSRSKQTANFMKNSQYSWNSVVFVVWCHQLVNVTLGEGIVKKLGKNRKCHLWKATLVKLQRVQTNFVPSKTKPRQQNKWLLFFWVCSAYLFRQKLSWKNLELSSAKVAWFLLELLLFWKTCMDMAKFAKS